MYWIQIMAQRNAAAELDKQVCYEIVDGVLELEI
jgi:hypothetical protein